MLPIRKASPIFNLLSLSLQYLNKQNRIVEEEIQTHLELETRENIEAGLSLEEARYAARRAFGSVALAKEDSRGVWGLRTLEILWQDLRYDLRMMLKRPGVTLIAIGMVAIGIAANTAVFSIADGLILRPSISRTRIG